MRESSELGDGNDGVREPERARIPTEFLPSHCASTVRNARRGDYRRATTEPDIITYADPADSLAGKQMLDLLFVESSKHEALLRGGPAAVDVDL